ncbi:hypothetical protein ND861_11480 [Leptospira sp. 2 VSF19]|uniref:Uncharacterized protein n=1 Tax=Leptospira soteropolitanensis TaxID=2950025 RepID=A0AAW5VP24_9LEPT|nr:hypothetical protein [Leptospira soteropolitanensis]MCW7493074.1 hypothetical protein [Leptospira soteropolitanensis]MCW7500857.1 hypothetical protein [Leptospira soteropolitanensis]MCW7522924.1 hypothetical protein [Leptospira soteropolitanensis]MCW7526969.1 hypothetical protein [Leptospira soteropolitanensis]MCW7530642.1 hypothetical protein [Leptospira soteropolitanensis]
MKNEIFHSFIKEQKQYKIFSRLAKYVSISFLTIYLYLLFSSSYTASPLIVVINYLAILTSFSGIITFKYFEIPSILLDVFTEGQLSPFFQLNSQEKQLVWRKAGREDVLPPEPTPDYISDHLHLYDRYPWKRIGKIYFVVYLVFILTSVFYLTSVYIETGFQN